MSLVKINFKLTRDDNGYPPVAVESLWARNSNFAGEYIIDSIPFFIREATLGDTIMARKNGGTYWFDSLISRSSNSLLRVVFFDKNCISLVSQRLLEMGCLTELLLDYNLMSVSIPREVLLKDVQDYLQLEMGMGKIDYEEPILRQ